MKKIISTILAATAAVALTACAPSEGGEHDLQTATITDTSGLEQEVFVNPNRIAVFSDAVLDILYFVDAFERLDLEILVVARHGQVPVANGVFNADTISGARIHNGGTLHFVNEDLLEMLQPQLVIMDGRSFSDAVEGANADARDDELTSGRITGIRGRMPYTRFIHLSYDIDAAQLEGDLVTMVTALTIIFPSLAADLNQELRSLQDGFAITRAFIDSAPGTGNNDTVRVQWVTLNVQGGGTSVALNGTNTRWSFLNNDFNFQEGVTRSAMPITAALNEGDALRDADIIFLFAHPNAPDGAINEFLNHDITATFSAHQNGTIVLIDRASWHTAPGGFAATNRILRDVQRGIVQFAYSQRP